MKKGLTIGLTATAAAAVVASLVSVGVSAGPLQRGEATRAAAADHAARTIPAYEIADSVRAAGLDPSGEPSLRGRYYVLHAVNSRGMEMRVLADAQDGDILSILPARRHPGVYRRYSGSARIIHVPRPDDAVAEDYYGDNVGASDTGNDRNAPPRPRQLRPDKRQRGEAPRVKRHIVSVAPLTLADEKDKPKDQSLTPVYPTPDFSAKAGGGEKFDPPPSQRPE